jgi:uncharacterized protein (DUF1684 family)
MLISRRMRRMWALAFVLAAVATGCGREQWPSPPPVDRATYQEEHEAWLAGERAYLSEVLPVTGIWPLGDGETSFGADPALPISLAVADVPPFAGTFRRVGDTVTVTPAADFALRLENGSRVDGETPMQSVLAGPFRLEVTNVGDDRRWVMAYDTTHPAITTPPELPSYPLDEQWRVAARLDTFDSPKRLRVPDVRGGFMEFTAIGELVFRVNGEELRLTAIGVEGDKRLAVWFKDRTNGLTTYGGYRVLRPQVVKDGEWTVLDFNFTYNPPCAYSTFTTCPLPPPENRLPVAIEAGLKQLPSVEGY